MEGNYFLGTVLATALTKLVSRFALKSTNLIAINGLKAESMLIMTSIILFGKSETTLLPIDDDSHERIVCCLRILSTVNTESEIQTVFLKDTRAAFKEVLVRQSLNKSTPKKSTKIQKTQPDDSISYRLFKGKKLDSMADVISVDLDTAIGLTGQKTEKSRLGQVVQLTGFSDPVYAEAYVNISEYDIHLDMLIINQTQNTLQNLTLEFYTLGDLKLVEKPEPQTVP